MICEDPSQGDFPGLPRASTSARSAARGRASVCAVRCRIGAAWQLRCVSGPIVGERSEEHD